jgi:integrase
MVAVFIYAGLRREEALWLQTEDIDLNAGTYGMIRVHAKEIDGRFWQPKTRRNRAVPISRALRSYLDRWTPPASDAGWYFPSPQGKHYDPDHFSQHLRDAQRKTALPFGCLDFRHTFGSQLAMKGESLYKISTLMGNSPEICRRHYAALIPEALADTVEFPQTEPAAPKRSIKEAQ